MRIVSKYPDNILNLSVEYCNMVRPCQALLTVEKMVIDCQSLDPLKIKSLKFFPNWPPIHVVELDEWYYVWDGRHRVVCAWLMGRPTLWAHVTPAPPAAALGDDQGGAPSCSRRHPLSHLNENIH